MELCEAPQTSCNLLRMGINADERAEPKLDCKEHPLLKFSGGSKVKLSRTLLLGFKRLVYWQSRQRFRTFGR